MKIWNFRVNKNTTSQDNVAFPFDNITLKKLPLLSKLNNVTPAGILSTAIKNLGFFIDFKLLKRLLLHKRCQCLITGYVQSIKVNLNFFLLSRMPYALKCHI